jgi:hypothetical protein
MLPELPTRKYEWRHDVRRRSSPAARSRRTEPTRKRGFATSAEFVIVGVLDGVLILALLHPALTRWVLELVR